MKLLFYVSFYFLTFQAFAQSSNQRINNNIFEDNFDDNRNNWIKDSDKDSAVTASINNGIFKIINKRKEGNWGYNTQNANIDYSKDFDIEVSFLIREDFRKYETALSIYWGLDDSLGSSWISISRRGTTIKNCYGGDHKDDTAQYSRNRPALKKGRSYKLTVQKRNDKCQVFLNSKLQVELFYSPLKGEKLVLAAWNNTAIEFDNFRIYNLE